MRERAVRTDKDYTPLCTQQQLADTGLPFVSSPNIMVTTYPEATGTAHAQRLSIDSPASALVAAGKGGKANKMVEWNSRKKAEEHIAEIQSAVIDMSNAWNRGDAHSFAARFGEDGSFTKQVLCHAEPPCLSPDRNPLSLLPRIAVRWGQSLDAIRDRIAIILSAVAVDDPILVLHVCV
ncbi:MAG: hypothetical protein ACREUT_09700 [Steroidobacteraceae bacterium]